MEPFRFEYGSPRSRKQLRIAQALGIVTLVCLVATQLTRGGVPPLSGDYFYFWVAVCGLLAAPVIVLHETRETSRTWTAGQHTAGYIEVDGASVRFALGGYSTAETRIPLAELSSLEVNLLDVRFRTRDGRVHVLPLGGLPYADVQRLKVHFAAWKPLPSAVRVAASPG